MNKINARNFGFSEIRAYKLCSTWDTTDIKTTVSELKNAGLGDMYYDGSFFANERFIIYMENRFKNGLLEVVDFISRFIS